MGFLIVSLFIPPPGGGDGASSKAMLIIFVRDIFPTLSNE